MRQTLEYCWNCLVVSFHLVVLAQKNTNKYGICILGQKPTIDSTKTSRWLSSHLLSSIWPSGHLSSSQSICRRFSFTIRFMTCSTTRRNWAYISITSTDGISFLLRTLYGNELSVGTATLSLTTIACKISLAINIITSHNDWAHIYIVIDIYFKMQQDSPIPLEMDKQYKYGDLHVA